MAALILAAVLIVILVAVLSLTKGGAKEPISANSMRAALDAESGSTQGVSVVRTRPEPHPQAPVKTLDERTRELLRALNLDLTKTIDEDDGARGYVAEGKAIVHPERVYVREFDLPANQVVQAPEVIAAIDYSRSEGFNKIVLISPSGFSDEALIAADGTNVELIDGAKLDQILARPS